MYRFGIEGVMMKLVLSIFVIISFTLISCKKNESNGIEIGATLYIHQDYETNKHLIQLIEEALAKNEEAIPKLTNFPCGGGAGCYDLSFVLTQIIYQIGEEEFNQMILRLDRNEINGLRSLISAGLEYGDHNADGKQDDRRIETEFPILDKKLK